jgi:hypothetical protein
MQWLNTVWDRGEIWNHNLFFVGFLCAVMKIMENKG